MEQSGHHFTIINSKKAPSTGEKENELVWKVTQKDLPETSETVSFSHETTVMYASTEEGIMHLKTATLPLMAFWSSTRTVYGSRKTKHRKILKVIQMQHQADK